MGFQRSGYYKTKYRVERIPRYLCKACVKTCSRQTFSTTYYLKRRELQVAIAAGLAAGSAHRQISRSVHCAKTTVTRQAERLGRHAVLFHTRSLGCIQEIAEPVVHDHFETFIGRQDHALGIGTAVGSNSWFVYDIDPAPHRGSGRRPDRKAADFTRPNQSYVASIRRTFQALFPRISEPNRLHAIVDGRIDYQAAIRLGVLRNRVRLSVYPNPKRAPKGSPRSPEAIARDSAMFPVDQLHQLIRHTCSDHKRETISFGRRLESIVGRAHLIAVWKNFIKSRSERKPDRTTPAMRLGLTETRWSWERVLTRRLFSSRDSVSEFRLALYRKRLTSHLPTFDRKHAV